MISESDPPSSSSASSSAAAAHFPHSDNDQAFVCNICLEGVKDKDPVVTQCGHLYCWPCLYRWLHTRNSDGTCPVCKAGVTQDNVIPIFIKESSVDPRHRSTSTSGANAANISVGGAENAEIIPNRPQGHRPEPVNPLLAGMSATAGVLPNNVAFNTQFGGASFSAGMGFFPSLFGLQFQSFVPPPAANASLDAEDEAHQAYLSRILFFLGSCVVMCLLFF